MDRSLAATLGIAVIAHAIAFAFVRPRPTAMRQPVAASVAADSQDVIELTDEPIAPAAQPTTPGITPIASEPTKVAVVAKGAPKDVVAIEIPSAPASSGGVEIVAPAGSGSEPPAKSASKIPSLINLDSPGSHAVIFPAGSGSTDTPASKEIATAKKLDAQLKAAMDAKDTEVGSGFGGPVVSAAHSAAGGIATLGWATFDVTTDSVGSVTAVRVVDFGGGGDNASWQGVAKDINANLGKTKLRVPSGAGGVSVRVRVEASMKYPSGATKPITPMIGAGSVGGEFDLADIGQKPKRLVQVRIITENRI